MWGWECEDERMRDCGDEGMDEGMVIVVRDGNCEDVGGCLVGMVSHH